MPLGEKKINSNECPLYLSTQNVTKSPTLRKFMCIKVSCIKCFKKKKKCEKIIIKLSLAHTFLSFINGISC